MSKLERIDVLEFKIKALQSRKLSIEGEIERLDRELKVKEKEAIKKIDKLISDGFEIIKLKQLNIEEQVKKADKMLAIVTTRERESLVIEEAIKKLDDKKKFFKLKEEELERNNTKWIEQTMLVKLRSEQLAKIIEEQGKTPETLKDTKKKK